MTWRVGVGRSRELNGACLEREGADGARNHYASWLNTGRHVYRVCVVRREVALRNLVL